MNRNAIDKSEHVDAANSDLRNTNPWLASYRSETARGNGASEARWVARSSGPSAHSLRLWVAAVVAIVLRYLAAHRINPSGSEERPLRDNRIQAGRDWNRRMAVLLQKLPMGRLR
jgi:hypothetical protein